MMVVKIKNMLIFCCCKYGKYILVLLDIGYLRYDFKWLYGYFWL